MNKSTLYALPLFFALAAGVQAQTPDTGNSLADNRIEWSGPSNEVIVRQLMSRPEAGGLNVQMELENTDFKLRRIYWRARWLDASGFQVWEDEVWKPVMLLANTRQLIQFHAPTPKATHFVVQINREDSGRPQTQGAVPKF